MTFVVLDINPIAPSAIKGGRDGGGGGRDGGGGGRDGGGGGRDGGGGGRDGGGGGRDGGGGGKTWSLAEAEVRWSAQLPWANIHSHTPYLICMP